MECEFDYQSANNLCKYMDSSDCQKEIDEIKSKMKEKYNKMLQLLGTYDFVMQYILERINYLERVYEKTKREYNELQKSYDNEPSTKTILVPKTTHLPEGYRVQKSSDGRVILPSAIHTPQGSVTINEQKVIPNPAKDELYNKLLEKKKLLDAIKTRIDGLNAYKEKCDEIKKAVDSCIEKYNESELKDAEREMKGKFENIKNNQIYPAMKRMSYIENMKLRSLPLKGKNYVGKIN